MIGIGDIDASTALEIFFVLLFIFIIIPSMSVFGFIKTKFFLKLNVLMRIIILILLYIATFLLGYIILVSLIPFGSSYCLIWTSLLFLIVLIFNLIMIVKTKYNNS